LYGQFGESVREFRSLSRYRQGKRQMSLQLSLEAKQQSENPKELEALLLCATTKISTQRIDRLKKLMAENIDWEALINLSSRHGTGPLLHKALQSVASADVPKGLAAELGKQAKTRAKQNFILGSELLKIKGLFDSLEIDFIPLKGPVLAAETYGSLSYRTFSDLDIIVQELDVPRAQAALLEAGYVPEPRERMLSIQFMQSELFRRLTPEQSFSRGGRGGGYPPFVIDLHWQLAPPYIMPIDFSTLFENTVQIELCGQQIQKLKPELELIYLCVHATKHQWREIRWVVDIHESIEIHPNLDWALLYQLAKSLGVERRVDIGMALCLRAFNTNLERVPESKRQEIESSAILRKVANITEDEWSWSEPRAETLRYGWWYAMSIADHFWQSLVLPCAELFYPTVPTYERCPLPGWLFPLYYVVHPAVLLFVFLMVKVQTLPQKAAQLNEAG
jgi:hypothetical protein